MAQYVRILQTNKLANQAGLSILTGTVDVLQQPGNLILLKAFDGD